MAEIRLDKILSEAGLASRRETKEYVKAGRIRAGDSIVSSADAKYDPEKISIYLDGELLDCRKFRYIMLHKPNGVLSATEDRSQQTVIDLLPAELKKLGIFPVGRLDKDTTGLLILTNDGAFSHSVSSPKRRVPKLYRAAVTGVLDQGDVAAFAAGLNLGDGTECLPAELEIERPSVGLVTVYEGKYHQVKRMFAARGKHVTALHRISVGGLVLDKSLKPGEYRELTQEERESIFT